ncbi:glutathione binding-like protein [Novosphingobium sp. MMS21-SN21R]|uniref:glutathione S-transferase family protein n=1 Tax=Novosphingobium sp. MMS21-SN21R TaxID=2969298 RepID=UPI0028841E18|nr:glutathione binding-like protein [Novosphingobium sp. MMS21-SN21R]MDT0509124.1 glutathione binding-like protein [Novosphingobium sp. MMS21-SN21R]
MSAILYHGQPNGASLTVLAALEESGLVLECRPIDLLAGERHSLPGVTEAIALDLGVEGEGPVLVIDGEAMTESVFLAQYFDEAAGGAGLQPSDAYAHWEMMMWCRQITERLSPAAALLGNLASSQVAISAIPADAFADLTTRIVSDDLRERWQALHDDTIDAAQVADSEAKVSATIERCETKLADGRDWLMGTFSIADLVTFSWLAGMRLLRADFFAEAGRTAAWLDRVAARPSVAAALARATVSEPLRAWVPGPEINRWG